MTPAAEKAKQLVDMFRSISLYHKPYSNIDIKAAKDCALICVKQVQDSLCNIYASNIVEKQNDWQEVKKEIEKM